MPVYVMRYPAFTRNHERLNRDELLNMGMTPAQVDHEMVRRHEIEVIEENFTRWVMAFGLVICMLLPVSLGLFLFLVYSYCTERDKECDAPLNMWFLVVLVNIIYHINLNGKSIHREVVRVICRYEAPGQPMETPPPRVRMYHLFITAFVFGWHCLGLHWVRTSETCHKTAPNLYKSVHLFASFNVVFTIFTTLFTFGLSQMLASLLRRGLLPATAFHPDRVAPEGTLELQETVPYDKEAFGEAVQCPTCLEDFSKEQTIKKTVCGHHFHEECLAPWLRVNRTCPLCRTDLAKGLPLQTTEPDTIGLSLPDTGQAEEETTTVVEERCVNEATTVTVGEPSTTAGSESGSNLSAFAVNTPSNEATSGAKNAGSTVVTVSPSNPDASHLSEVV